jgi:hypothetical protein
VTSVFSQLLLRPSTLQNPRSTTHSSILKIFTNTRHHSHPHFPTNKPSAKIPDYSPAQYPADKVRPGKKDFHASNQDNAWTKATSEAREALIGNGMTFWWRTKLKRLIWKVGQILQLLLPREKDHVL